MSHIIGNRVGAKHRAQLIDGEIHQYYAPMIEVDGKKIFISNDCTKSGLEEAQSRYEALKKARVAIDRIKNRMLEVSE